MKKVSPTFAFTQKPTSQLSFFPTVLFSLILVFGWNIGWGQTTILNFDTDGDWTAVSVAIGSYGNHTYSKSNWSFQGANVLRNGTAAQDGFAGALGTYSWRLRDAASTSLTATFNSSATISSFGFDVRRWDNSPDPNFTIEYTINSGANWTSTGTTINNTYLGSSNWKTFTFSLPSATAVTSGQFRVRIVRSSGERIMIDNFQWTVAAATPTISSSGTLSALSTTYGTASSNTSFSVSGANMTAGISVNPPAGFQVSTTSDFSSNVGSNGSPITVGAAGTIASTTVYVRLAATTIPGSYSGNIVLSSSGATNVNVATVSSTVNTKALTISGLTGANKVYDATTTASSTGTPSLVGIVGGDVVTLSGSPSLTFANATVGTAKAITVTGYTLSGAQAARYTLTQPTGLTGDITTKSLTITADDVTKTAGSPITGGAGSTAFSSSGLVGGQTIGSVTIAYGSAGAATGDGATPGVYFNQVTPSSATGGTFTASNYSITYVQGSITVEAAPASPTISVSGSLSALSTTYGTPSSTTSFTVSGAAMTTGITITPPTGFEVATTSDFSTTIGTTSSPLVIGSAGTIANTTVYVRLRAVATVAGSPHSGNITLTSTGASIENIATSSSTVSTKTLTISGLIASNKVYDGNTTVSVTGTPSYVGLVNGESFSVSGSPTFAFATKTVGNSKLINQTGSYIAPSSNYTVTQPTLTADITAKTLTTSGASAQNKVYDATTTATITGTSLVGVESGDVVSVSGGGTFASANVGNGISVTASLSLSGADAGNYTLTQPTLTANITAKALTVTANNVSKEIGATLTGGSGSTAFISSGLIGGQTIGTVTIAYGTGAAAGDAVGTYTSQVTPSLATGGTFSASNYSITYVSGNITVQNTTVVSLTALGTVATEDFNTLANSGTSSTTPTGWYFTETGSNSNYTYSAGTGSNSAGDTYSFGLSSNSDRALGALFSSSLQTTIGGKFLNNTGSTINNLFISYTGETWRVGANSRSDRLDFQYSIDATSLTTGTWTDFNALDYSNPGQATGNGSLQHSASISDVITGLTINNGSSFWIRWNDFNASGSDDGMGVDDFSIKPCGTVSAPTASAQSFCSATSPTVASLVATGTAIQWYAASSGGSVLSTSAALATGTYYASQTLGGCESTTRTSVVVTVNTNPSAPTASAQSICSAISPTVTSLVATGTAIQWYAASSGGSPLSGATSLTSTDYFATQTVSGCESTTRTSVAVTLNPDGTWIGGSTGNWNNASNWCGGVPNSFTAEVSVPSGVTITLDASIDLGSLTIPTGASVVAGSNSITIATDGSFSNSGTFNAGTGSLIYAGTGTLTGTTTFNNLSLNGTLSMSNSPTVNGSVTLNSGALIEDNPIIYGSTSTLIYNNGGALSSTNYEWPTSNSPRNVTIQNNTELTLNSLKKIEGTFNFINGIVISSATNLLEIGSSASTTGSINWTAGTVVGPMKRWFGTAANNTQASGIFPVGLHDQNRLAVINFAESTAGGYILMEYKDQLPVVLDDNDEPLDDPFGLPLTYMVNGQRKYIQNADLTGYWDITPYSAAGVAYDALDDNKFDITLRINSDVIQNAPVTANPPGMRIIRAKGNPNTPHNPFEIGAAAAIISQVQGSTPGTDYLVRSNGLQGFSWFNIGGDNETPLPVELLFFNGQCTEQGNILRWATASEFNSSHYDVEASSDGENWNVVNTIAAAGFSTEKLNYQTVDMAKNEGTLYYRLRQVDINGDERLYNPIAVSCGENGNMFTTYPNPSNESFTLLISDESMVGQAVLTIRDINGRLISSSKINILSGSNSYEIKETLPSGMYFIQVENGMKVSSVLRQSVR